MHEVPSGGQKMPITDYIKKKGTYKIVPIDELPRYTPKNAQSQYWIEIFRSIPPGQALVTTEEEIGVKVGTLVSKVIDYQKKGWISKGYRIRQKRRGETRDVFILHEAVKEQKGGVE
jgi:hypothetical protein